MELDIYLTICYRLRFRSVRLPGTLAPFFRASDKPIAIACLRLVTFLPLPDSSVPFLRRRIALATRLDAASPYFRLREDFLAAIPVLLRGELRRTIIGLAHVVPKNPSVQSNSRDSHTTAPP